MSYVKFVPRCHIVGVISFYDYSVEWDFHSFVRCLNEPAMNVLATADAASFTLSLHTFSFVGLTLLSADVLPFFLHCQRNPNPTS